MNIYVYVYVYVYAAVRGNTVKQNVLQIENFGSRAVSLYYQVKLHPTLLYETNYTPDCKNDPRKESSVLRSLKELQSSTYVAVRSTADSSLVLCNAEDEKSKQFCMTNVNIFPSKQNKLSYDY